MQRCNILPVYHGCWISNVRIFLSQLSHDLLYYVQRFPSKFLMFIILVATNCNNGNSFRCGPDRCIPKVFKCDGMIDCLNGEDEVGCQFPNSCQEWWDAGYHENGIYPMSKCFM